MKKPDLRRDIKLDAENSRWLSKLSKNCAFKISVAALANAAILRSRKWMETYVTTTK